MFQGLSSSMYSWLLPWTAQVPDLDENLEYLAGGSRSWVNPSCDTAGVNPWGNGLE